MRSTPGGHGWVWGFPRLETPSSLCISWSCRALVSLSCPQLTAVFLSPLLPPPSSHLNQASLEGAISAPGAACEPEEAVPVNNSWGWEALISQAGPTRGPSTGPPSRSSSLYLDAQLVMQPAISQAEGEINFLVLRGRGGEGA